MDKDIMNKDKINTNLEANLFSKEGVLETKSLAYELGLDNDWNSWISLSNNPSTLT